MFRSMLCQAEEPVLLAIATTPTPRPERKGSDPGGPEGSGIAQEADWLTRSQGR